MSAGGGAQDRSRARRRSLRVGLAAWLLALLAVVSGSVALDRGSAGPQVLLAAASATGDNGILPSAQPGSSERTAQVEERQKRLDRLVPPPSGGEAAVSAAAMGPSVGAMAVAPRPPTGDVGRSSGAAPFDARAPPRAA